MLKAVLKVALVPKSKEGADDSKWLPTAAFRIHGVYAFVDIDTVF